MDSADVGASRLTYGQGGYDREALGKPALVCRWRLAGGRLPLANRHLRALRSREVAGARVPLPLVAWAKEHVEWTLEQGAQRDPDGVLMLVIDEHFHAAMTVGPYKPLATTTLKALARRAKHAQLEAEVTRVAPETLWLIRDGQLEWLDDRINVASGAATLIGDLARTLGVRVVRRDVPSREEPFGAGGYEGAFLVSDEHGVCVPSDRPSDQARRFADGYQKLLEKTMNRRRLAETREQV